MANLNYKILHPTCRNDFQYKGTILPRSIPGQLRSLFFEPTEFTRLQSNRPQIRKEQWALDQRTVEVCSIGKGLEARIVVPCVTEYELCLWDEFESSVCHGEIFEVDAGDIPGIRHYGHDVSSGQLYEQQNFDAILSGGTVNWERKGCSPDPNIDYLYEVSFSVRVVNDVNQDHV